jgi:hypothetical protein
MEALFAVEPAARPAPGAAEATAPEVAVRSDRAPRSSGWLIGLLALILAGVLVFDGVLADFVPGGRDWGLNGDSSGWLVYLFAVVVLTVATRAVHGGALALRLLFALALIFFIERAFSPFALRVVDPVALGLHGLAALISLALALATASAIRNGGAQRDARRASAATGV